jgi:hypothetical protein
MITSSLSDKNYLVNKNDFFCTCLKPIHIGIPCSHIISTWRYAGFTLIDMVNQTIHQHWRISNSNANFANSLHQNLASSSSFSSSNNNNNNNNNTNFSGQNSNASINQGQASTKKTVSIDSTKKSNIGSQITIVDSTQSAQSQSLMHLYIPLQKSTTKSKNKNPPTDLTNLIQNTKKLKLVDDKTLFPFIQLDNNSCSVDCVLALLYQFWKDDCGILEQVEQDTLEFLEILFDSTVLPRKDCSAENSRKAHIETSNLRSRGFELIPRDIIKNFLLMIYCIFTEYIVYFQ